MATFRACDTRANQFAMPLTGPSGCAPPWELLSRDGPSPTRCPNRSAAGSRVAVKRSRLQYNADMHCSRLHSVTAVALAAIALAAQGAETAPELTRRDLSGGTAVTAAEAPFLVFLRIPHITRYTKCLGTLIAADWIVTAAHCVSEADFRYIAVAHVSGGKQLGALGRAAHEARSSDVQIHRHPDWDPTQRTPTMANIGNDIALLKLPIPFQRPEVHPARLPTASEAATIQPGLTVRTIGQTSEFWQAARTDWPIHPNRKTRASVLAMRMFPAKVELGDSGGPTLLRIGQEWVLIGVNSSSDSTTAFAASTSYHAKWITTTIGGTEPPSTEPPDSQPPGTLDPGTSGTLTLTLRAANLEGLACTLTTEDGTRSTSSGGGSSLTTVNWTVSGSFKRDVFIECEPQ